MNKPKRTIKRAEVEYKTGLSRANLFKLEKANDFPHHFMLTPRLAVWYEHEVDNWIEARAAARHAAYSGALNRGVAA